MTVGDLKIAIADLYVENMILNAKVVERDQKIEFLQKRLADFQSDEAEQVQAEEQA